MNANGTSIRQGAICYLTLTRVVFELYFTSPFSFVCVNLTLTRVVFEFHPYACFMELLSYLTLTRVVFEFDVKGKRTKEYILFNFNKSCI